MWAMTFGVLTLDTLYGAPTPAANLAPVTFLPSPDDLTKLHVDMVRLVASSISRNVEELGDLPKAELPYHEHEDEMCKKSSIGSMWWIIV